MAAEIVGIDKINYHLERNDFKKIELKKGKDTRYLTPFGIQNKEEIIEDFNNFYHQSIESNNFITYYLELTPDQKNLPVIRSSVAFFPTNATGNPGIYPKKENNTMSNNIDTEKYIALAVRNAQLEAQISRIEEKMDELLSDDEDDEVGQVQPTFSEAINATLIGKIDTIVDVVLGMLAKPNVPAASYAINGIQETDDLLIEFRKVHADIDQDIALFYKLAVTQPKIFKMVIGQLRDMV